MARKRSQPARRVVLTDPRAIRALAHPARIAILEALFGGEELTATEFSALTGLSASATSYHLKALEKWGIVEPGEGRSDGRDRPWRATGRSLEVDSRSPKGTTIAEDTVIGLFLDRNRAVVTEFLEGQSLETKEWRDAVNLSTGDHWLTAREVRGVVRGVAELLKPYRKRRRDSHPLGSRQVRVSCLTVPRAIPGGSREPSRESVGKSSGKTDRRAAP